MNNTRTAAARTARHDADPGVPAAVQLLVAVVVLAGGALGGHAWLADTCPAGTAPAAVCEATGL